MSYSEEQKKEMAKAAGREPLNPIGKCFDSAAYQVVIGGVNNNPPDVRLCHGIGVTQVKGQENMQIAHAWVEGDGVALDTTWGLNAPAKKYRKAMKLDYVVEYTMEEAKANWQKFGNAGPWDEKIKKVIGDFRADQEAKGKPQ